MASTFPEQTAFDELNVNFPYDGLNLNGSCNIIVAAMNALSLFFRAEILMLVLLSSGEQHLQYKFPKNTKFVTYLKHEITP